jgi:hypothetical protein
VVRGAWTYYGAAEGLPGTIHDVSADEAGNVYVAGGDGLYAKRRSDRRFLRFDADNAGLTRNCNDPPPPGQQVPPKPFFLCPVISVAGAAPGKAIVGLEGLGVEHDVGVSWVLASGGADVVAFDAERGTLGRTRHVHIASPPGVVCGVDEGVSYPDTCSDPTDNWWLNGRRLLRQVFRIVVNHDASSAMYGDAWMGGNHGTFSVLLANAAARGWTDRTAGLGPDIADAKDVWEHHHPSFVSSTGLLLIGEGWALSIDPRTGFPWGSNGVRTAYVAGYGADLSATPKWWMDPWNPVTGFIDLWPDAGDEWLGPTNDHVRSMSHCPDGTLWIASSTHGLARIDPGGAITTPALPAGEGPGVSAIACDPSDHSVWIGLEAGGVGRLRGATFEPVQIPGVPAFAGHRVASIQVDRWSSPRTVYFAFAPTKDAGGGIGSYDGP